MRFFKKDRSDVGKQRPKDKASKDVSQPGNASSGPVVESRVPVDKRPGSPVLSQQKSTSGNISEQSESVESASSQNRSQQSSQYQPGGFRGYCHTWQVIPQIRGAGNIPAEDLPFTIQPNWRGPIFPITVTEYGPFPRVSGHGTAIGGADGDRHESRREQGGPGQN